MQALMLAAGMGQRMGEDMEAIAKCMIQIGGKTLLERTADALKLAGIQKLVMVVGWNCERLTDEIRNRIPGMEFEFVYNRDYAVINNIYSLYLAREQLGRDDTLLLESDLIYDTGLLQRIIRHPAKDLAVVSKYQPWMDGTVTTIAEDGTIDAFIEKQDIRQEDAQRYWKTVNIYKFSRDFSQNRYIPQLEKHIRECGKNQYYELVLKELTGLSLARLAAFDVADMPWYEVDTIEDLRAAALMFDTENTVF